MSSSARQMATVFALLMSTVIGVSGCGKAKAPAPAPAANPSAAAPAAAAPKVDITAEQLMALRTQDIPAQQKAFGEWGLEPSIAAVSKAMSSNDPQVRRVMGEWLVLLGPHGTQALMNALSDPNVDARNQAALATSLGVPTPGGTLSIPTENITDWSKVIAVLVEGIKDESPDRVVQMQWEVTEEVNGAIKRSLVPTNIPVSKQAKLGLSSVGGIGYKTKGVAASLVPFLKDDNAAVRLASCEALQAVVIGHLSWVGALNQFGDPVINPANAKGAIPSEVKFAMDTLRSEASNADPQVAESITAFLTKYEPKWELAAKAIPELR